MTPRTCRRPWVAGATCVVTALALAGCSSFADKPADEIEAAVRKDMQDATALTMQGVLNGIDLRASMDDEGDCLVTMRPEGGGAADFIVVKGEKAYLKANESYLRQATAGNNEMVDLLANRWVEHDVAKTKSFCDLEGFLDEFDEDDGEKVEAKKGDEAKVNGKDTVALIDEKDDGGTTTVWVAIDGKHYILKVAQKGGEQPGSMLLSDYDKDVEAEEPDDVFEVPKP